MRFAILSDIHANLEALEAVLADARSQNCTHFVCLGDVVGYNANPSECVKIIQDLECPVAERYRLPVAQQTAPCQVQAEPAELDFVGHRRIARPADSGQFRTCQRP